MFRSNPSFEPAFASSGAAAMEVACVPLSLRGERVAIVDDEREMADVTKTVLQKLGYATVTYGSAARFLKAYLANPEPIDLVVTDLVMPGMTGVQLAKFLRENGHEVPILLMTGFAVQPRPQWEIGSGRTALVRKPFNSAQLGQAVRRLLSS
jgi:FixJ family two-component response regulator